MTIGARPTPRAVPPSPPPAAAGATRAPDVDPAHVVRALGDVRGELGARGQPAPERTEPLDRHPAQRAQAPPPPPPTTTTTTPTHSGRAPTLIDLRLKEARSGGRTRKGGRTSKKASAEFALVARVHAPHPRPPFHLLASTVDIIPYAPSPQPHTGIPPPDPQANRASAPAAPAAPRTGTPTRARRRARRSRCTSRGPSAGPLTVHVGAGDLDAHVRLSPGMQGAAAAVVLAETAYARGFFVGTLGGGRERGAWPWVVVGRRRGAHGRQGCGGDGGRGWVGDWWGRGRGG